MAAPIRNTGSRRASSPSLPGTRCSSAQLLIRPESSELAELRPRAHHRRSADLQGRSEAPRRAHRHHHRHRLHQEDHPDRQLVLCRRDEEVGVHHAQLLPAGAGRDADALLGQCRQGRRRRAVLRPLRHRQDHALGRPEPHADRRRRARLGPGRRVQFRGRLLRQVHQALGARPSPRSTPRPTASARCWRTWCSIRRRGSRTIDDDSKTENTRSAYPLDFMPRASRTGRAGIPRTSSFSPPTPSA